MKTLKDLNINSGRMLNNEELITLKGGLLLCFFDCSCSGYQNPPYNSPNFTTAAFTTPEIASAINAHCDDAGGTCTQNFCIN